MAKTSDLILVVDSNWYLHRALYTLKSNRPLEDVLPYRLAEMVAKDGMLLRATHLMCAFDGPKNFRKDLYPEYKANREGNVGNGDEYGEHSDGESQKAKMYETLPVIFDRFTQWGIPFYQPRKREADDVLCSVAHHVNGKMRFVGGTQDKDAFQYLLTKHMRLMDSSNGTKEIPAKFITRQTAEKKKGVSVEQMVDYQTLIGDTGDNVKPVPGIGPAKAKAILAKWGTLKNWIENTKDADEKDLIAKHKEKMRLNRKLVKLTQDAVPPGDIDEWKLSRFKCREAGKLSRNYHELHNLMWPKTRGLFG